MRKFIKDYLAKEYDNYVKDLEALTNIDSDAGTWCGNRVPL